MNLSQSPRCGTTWSTTEARVRIPRRAHSRQNGSRRSCAGRSSDVQMGRLYQACHWADTLLPAFSGLCFAQYPSRVSAGHPGCRHGLNGFKATGYHLRAKQKAPKPRHPFGSSQAQALVSLDAGSGASIFTTVSCPHRLHLQGKLRTAVVGRIFRSFPFPHTGQSTHPSFTGSLTRFSCDCNGFTSLSPRPVHLLYLLPSPINIRGLFVFPRSRGGR